MKPRPPDSDRYLISWRVLWGAAALSTVAPGWFHANKDAVEPHELDLAIGSTCPAIDPVLLSLILNFFWTPSLAPSSPMVALIQQIKYLVDETRVGGCARAQQCMLKLGKGPVITYMTSHTLLLSPSSSSCGHSGLRSLRQQKPYLPLSSHSLVRVRVCNQTT